MILTPQEILMNKILDSITDGKTDSTDWIRLLTNELTDEQSKELTERF